MKGNNGQAARKRMLRRFLLGGGFCLGTIGVLLLLASDLLFASGGASSDNQRLLRSENVEKVKEGVHKLQDKARKFRQDLHQQNSEQNEADKMEQILQAEIHLVSLGLNEEELERSHPSTYAGVYGHFCKLNFAAHKKDPAAVPMFRDLVKHSPDCENTFKVDLKKVVDLARRRDQLALEHQEAVPKVLNLTAVAFHESRCGSTLVANALLAMDPAKHRTYSESQPGAQALKQTCGDVYNRCTVDQAAAILKDTVYMMSRSNDPQEERVFFKFQSITTKNIEVFQKAFPQVPWMFVYRDPVQVMMSHIKDDPSLKYAKCVSTQKHPPKDIKRIAKRHGRDAKTMAREEYCAAHLAAISEAAVDRLNDYGIPMNYDGLIERLYTQVLPRLWGRALTLTEISNIQKVSQTYSKGRGKRHVEFHGDSEQKSAAASEAVKEAAALVLKPSFDSLEEFAPKLMERDLPPVVAEA